MPSPSQPPTLVFGVLGGVAAGKSTVAALLAGENGQILAADTIAREILESPEGCQALLERYGPLALDEQGVPNRPALAARIFEEPLERSWLESWTHPRVRARILSDLDQARRAGVPRVVLDVPLLMENDPQHHLMAECDHFVFVEVSDAERDRRAVASRGWAPGEVARREAVQLPLDIKRSKADFVIAGEVSLTELAQGIDKILRRLGL